MIKNNKIRKLEKYPISIETKRIFIRGINKYFIIIYLYNKYLKKKCLIVTSFIKTFLLNT